MEYREWKNLTDEQKKKYWQCCKRSMWITFKFGVKAMFYLILANGLVVAINNGFVNSPDFIQIGLTLNAVFYFYNFLKFNRKERDRFTEETKKILEK